MILVDLETRRVQNSILTHWVSWKAKAQIAELETSLSLVIGINKEIWICWLIWREISPDWSCIFLYSNWLLIPRAFRIDGVRCASTYMYMFIVFCTRISMLSLVTSVSTWNFCDEETWEPHETRRFGDFLKMVWYCWWFRNPINPWEWCLKAYKYLYILE